MKKIILVSVIMLFSAAMVFAGDDAFQKVDKNKDGKISKQEFMDQAARNFDKVDNNSDGALGREEIKSGSNVDAQKLMDEVECVREEKIVKAKYLQAAERQFKSMDKNQDGYIDIKEWTVVRSMNNPPALVLFTF